MPLVVKRDNEYYPGIVEKLADLVFELERCGASDKIVLAVKEYHKKIISSIILYYQGDLVDAQLIVNEMLDEFNDAAPSIQTNQYAIVRQHTLLPIYFVRQSAIRHLSCQKKGRGHSKTTDKEPCFYQEKPPSVRTAAYEKLRGFRFPPE